MRYFFGFIFVLALGVMGCSESDADGECRGSLSDYCAQVECLTWDAQIAKVECPGSWEIGTCGEFRYVWHQYFGASDYWVRYFDASGALVAHYHHTDVNAHCGNTSWDILYGRVPDCVLEPTELSREDCYAATPSTTPRMLDVRRGFVRGAAVATHPLRPHAPNAKPSRHGS